MAASTEIDAIANPKYGEIEEIVDEVEKRFAQFKNFEIIRDDPPWDHQYCLEYKSKVLLGSTRGQRMEQECKLLEECLPESIFVRAYATQIDVLRAAIIGPPNTPYSHSLFFFDILIPKGYPSSPPKLHYWSYDISLSPSLGKDGKVNLKLLESWYGRIVRRPFGSNQEKWNPNESTILDVLLAIQKSISEDGPYNDEPFVERCQWANEAEYNKKVWLSTCEGMMRTLHKPPRDFEVLVRGHFRKNAHAILMRFRDIKDDGEIVTQLFYKLLTAFKANGTYCEHHLGYVGQVKEGKGEQDVKKQKNEYVTKMVNSIMSLVN